MKKGQAIIEVVNGVEGPSLYIGDENSGHRLAGPKPWGGGRTVFKFVVDVAELQEEAARFEKKPQRKPLTDEQALNALDAAGVEMHEKITCAYELQIFRTAEAAHGIKE